MKQNLLLFLFFGCLMANAQKKVNATTYRVEEKSVSATLKFLSSDALQGRLAGSKGLETAAQYLEDIFVKNGVKP